MGIDCGSEEGPSSPVFHKKKWVVLPTSLKRTGSGSLLTKCPEKKLKNKRKNDSNKSQQSLSLNNTAPSEDKALKNTAEDEDDPVLIYSTTPTKTYKQKRKTIDLLSCSFRSEGSFCKKSKLNDEEHAEVFITPSGINLEKNINSDIVPETLTPTSVKGSSPQSNKSNISQKNIFNKPQRKLLYSCNEKSNSGLTAPTLTVNDIFKSVIMIDEADIHSSPKKNRKISFEGRSSDFQSVTSLTSENPKDCPKEANDPVSSYHISTLEKCNDSFGNCMFTEIENECVATKDVCSKSNYGKGSMTTNSPKSPVDINPMDETFSNYRFTEIEEDYSCFNHKRLKDSDPMASFIKSDIGGTSSLCSDSHNHVGRNTSLMSEHKDDCPSNKLISKESGVLKNRVEVQSYHSLSNERDKIFLQENGLENSFLQSGGDENDIFNSTILPQKSITKLETAIDKETFLSTSKECFDDLDAISTEEFRNKNLVNHHHHHHNELNSSSNEDILNKTLDSSEKDMLNKSSISKLDVTLTDIMQRLLKKRVNNESKPNLKNQSLDKHITSNSNSCFNALTQEITEEETKNHELCDQTLRNISSSECIPESFGLSNANETVFLTQEYLENAKSEVSVDSSVIYYQQSFDYMISAEVKSRLSGNNAVVHLTEQEPILLDQSLSSEVSKVADNDGRSPDDSFMDINHKHTNLNESNASNLNESINVIENTLKSPTYTDYFNDSSEIKFSQYEHISQNPVISCSTALLGVKELKKVNSVEMNSNKVHSNCNKFSNEMSSRTGVSVSNSDFISQGCLQQFNCSFQLESDDSVLRKKENNLDSNGIKEINVSNVNSHHSTFSTIANKNIKISEECPRNEKSKCKDILEKNALITQKSNTMSDTVFFEDSDVLEKKNSDSAVNLINLSESESINIYEMNECNKPTTKCSSNVKNLNVKQMSHTLQLGTLNSTHDNVNNDILETVQLDRSGVFKKPDIPMAHQKLDVDYNLATSSCKNINTSEQSLIKISSILADKNNVSQCFTGSNVTSLSVHRKQFSSDKTDLTESSSSFNIEKNNIGVSKSELSVVHKTEANKDYLSFKSALARPDKIDNFMFSSAGGKKIGVSENALAKVKSMFYEILESDLTENKDKTDINQAHKTSLPGSSKAGDFMFSSASGKNIQVSEDSLARVKSKFNNILESDVTENKDKIGSNQAQKTSLPGSSKAANFMFSSASGKNIKVSEDSLTKVKSKFNDIFENSLTEINHNGTEMKNNPSSKSFLTSSDKVDNFMLSTASGNNNKVPEDALVKTKSKCKEISKSHLTEKNNENITDINHTNKFPCSSKNDNVMFSTAGGKNIKVSDVALAKVKSKFIEFIESHETEVMNDIVETNIDQKPKIFLPSSSKTSNLIFSSACGESVDKVSEEPAAQAESKSNKILESHLTPDKNTEDKTDFNLNSKTSRAIPNQTVDFMFSSATGKNNEISENAHVDTKFNDNIFERRQPEVKSNETETNISQVYKTSLHISDINASFSTAGGKNITVSDVALAKIKSKFNEIMESLDTENENPEDKIDIYQTPKISIPSSSKNNDMFTTAGGKNIKISDVALAKVQNKFNDIMDRHETEVIKDIAETNIDQTSKIFLPSSSKTSNLSDLTEKKDKIAINQVYDIPLSRSSKAGNFMFSSAGGEKIGVSEKAVAKVKSMFNELLESDITEKKDKTGINEAHKTSLPESSKAGNFMFSSASGKSIQVSEDSLAKVKSKFNEILGTHQTEVKADITVAKKDSYEASKTFLLNSSKADNFTFSSASGKNIKVSEDSLAKVKSKFNEIMESHDTEPTKVKADRNIDQATKTFFPSSSLAGNFMFLSGSGKNVKVSEDALAKVKCKFNDIFENSLTEANDQEKGTNGFLSKSFFASPNKVDDIMISTTPGNSNNVSDAALAKIKSNLNEISLNISAKEGNNETEINECQLLETSFSYFDKTDPFSFPVEESNNIEISNVILEEMKSKLNRSSKDNLIEVELNKSRDGLCELSNVPLTVTDKKDNPIPLSADFNVSINEKISHLNELESFPPGSKTNEIKCENAPDKCLGIMFSTARGKQISVSEDALLKVRSKFSEVMDTSMPLFEDEQSNDYIFQHLKYPNKKLSDDLCLDKKNLNAIESCSKEITIPNNQTPTNSKMFTKVGMNKKLFNSPNLNDKKSKSSHTENSSYDQPFAKKVCFQPGIVNLTQKQPNDLGEHNILKESKMSYSTFTQSISQSFLDKEMDLIEKTKCPREILNLKDSELNSQLDENKDLESKTCDGQLTTEESDMTMIYEVSDSAAAFMADCTPDRSVLSSPASFFNRKTMKPIKLLEMEFDDVDDEIMVAAELEIIPKPVTKNPVTDDSLACINFRSCSVEVLSIRKDQRKKIDEIINQKLKCRPLSSPGLYMTLRNKGSLKRISEILHPFLNKEQLFQLGLKEEILCISSINAETYEFCAESFFNYEECFSAEGIINVGYGFSLILSDDNKIGFNELSRCFLSNPNVDPSLVSSAWIKNHYKWIVWKLASYERAFPTNLSNRYLTPENVLHQLKYRYDREIDLAQRPALKKILECDEPSLRRLIACVADIRNVDSSDGESTYEIELTDGWYSVWTCIDPAMKNLIDRQKVKIGMKLIIQAAELLNCTEGCDPLEIASSICLKLHTNCVRRVKWHTKIGFTRHPGPIRISLSSVLHNGGLVGLTSAMIARVYPLLYMSKDADGKTVFRNAYAEQHASSLKENDLTLKSEELFEKLFPQVEAKYKSGVVKFDKNNIKNIKNPELLWKIVSNESDPSEVQSLMSPDQLLEVRKYHELISSKIREEVQALVKKKLEDLIPSQKAKCLLKLRLVDPVGGCNALLTIWNPSEDLLQILVEKRCFDFYNINASGIRDKVLQLSSTSRTMYKESNVLKPSQEFGRKVTTIHDIVVNSVSVQFGEMDVVGTVIFVKEPEKPWGVTNVYLSDSQESFLMITFWTSLKTFGCDDTLKPGSTVACINLQWRQGSGSYVIPSTYANEMTYFSSNPNQEYLVKALQEIKSSIGSKNLENFILEQRRRLFTILKEREYTSKTPLSKVETPKVLKRLENLKKYGEASPLPKLSLLSSPDIHRKFRSPKSGGS
ncbi:unnamed protein product [Nezara viridula]|uniref:Uncharacterized protein n=1 Tax=Nezara viridula TaxID=85310 RepID=A0A9P0E2Q4_NEZVI|nr:unnamed protein product [Nezara viridula]